MQNNIVFIIHSVVKLASVAYLLFKLWQYLHYDKFFLWKLFIPAKKDDQIEKELPTVSEEPVDIVGKTNTVFIQEEDIRNTEPMEINPVRSEELEPEIPLVDDSDDFAADEDVDYTTISKTPEEILEGEERFFSLETDDNITRYEFSGGLTFDNITNAVEVIIGKQMAEDKKKEAAHTIYETSQTDMFELIVANTTNEEMVIGILNEYLGESNTIGTQLATRRKERIASFDMEMFVD